MHVSRIENSLRRAGGPSASARATECRRTELAVMLDLTCVRLRNRWLKVGPGAPSLGDSPSGIRRRHSPPGSARTRIPRSFGPQGCSAPTALGRCAAGVDVSNCEVIVVVPVRLHCLKGP